MRQTQLVANISHKRYPQEEKAGLDSKGTKEKKENKEAKEVKALVPVYPVEMAEPVKFATHWIRQGLRSSVGSILLK